MGLLDRVAAPIWQMIDSSSVGGAERHIALLAAALGRQGFRVEVVLLADYGASPWFEQLSAAGVRWRVLDGSFTGLVRALREARPALVHTHGYKAGILGRLAATPLGIPRVSTFHSGQRGPFPLWAYQRADEWTSCLGARIAVSEPIRRSLPFSAPVIPNWVDAPDTQPDGPLPACVGFVGRLNLEKGPDLFCELARRSRPGLEWRVYGDGPMRAELEQRFGDIVQFKGIVSDMHPVWPELGLLCMPSRSEGLPLAALEALAAGVPVLASRVGDLPAAVVHGETGWLFASGDLDEAIGWMEAWRRRVSTDADLLRRACWEHVRRNFTERLLLPRTIASYRIAGLRTFPEAACESHASGEGACPHDEDGYDGIAPGRSDGIPSRPASASYVRSRHQA